MNNNKIVSVFALVSIACSMKRIHQSKKRQAERRSRVNVNVDRLSALIDSGNKQINEPAKDEWEPEFIEIVNAYYNLD